MPLNQALFKVTTPGALVGDTGRFRIEQAMALELKISVMTITKLSIYFVPFATQ